MHLWLTLLAEGVFRRRSADGARVRRPRTGFANLDPGGLRGSTWASLRAPRQELADGQVAIPSDLTRSVARGQKSPRWSAGRRAGPHHGPAISGEPEIGPTARRATRCGGFRTSAVSALRPPHV